MNEGNLQTNVKEQKPEARSQKSELQMLALGELRESKSNPRSEWGKEGLEELAASIRSHGVLEPLLVRPLGNGQGPGAGDSGLGKDGDSEIEKRKAKSENRQFEIVVGARRFRAAKLAKVEMVPAIVRALSDREALEIQIIENLQREDINALDEARGYKALLEVWKAEDSRQGAKAPSEEQGQGQKAKGKGPKETAEILRSAQDDKTKEQDDKSLVVRLAERVGKSASYVYQRLKLCELAEPAAKALAEGKMTAGHAVQIARLAPKTQEQILKSRSFDWENKYGGPGTVRQLGDFIQREIHRNLSQAPWKWDDAALLPKAGACSVCPKRAGNNPQVYPDLKAETCTDGACFEAKHEAWLDGKIAALKAGTGKEALRLRGSGYYGRDDKAVDYSTWHERVVKKGSCENVEAGVIVGGDGLGETRWLCRNNKCKTHAKAPRREARGAQCDYKAVERLHVRMQSLTLEAIFAKVTKVGAAEAQVILECFIEAMGYNTENELVKVIAGALKCPKDFANVKPEERLRAVYGLALTYAGLDAEAKRLKIDVKTIEKRAKEELKPKKEEKLIEKVGKARKPGPAGKKRGKARKG